ncbi:synaptotagmin-17 [Octopus bimaculoides]|uniref:Synaptotagmin-17 n=1 Tax=Octopus bimaculoides TaxID=37653 RepID=A0A0L8FZF6_OCTBM|nr:synaptotagmin-17 [Octopus bimaculoides]XP_052823765.1 synaptotagmin-17 [Octopus bimaculoides]XP_052823766.1 synaptotagmin-17 [Octopus bimaculoides]|eukprot:XP_014785596.1 PREDICTED: synaptotagmin-17-like [Octopus bimaculoides]
MTDSKFNKPQKLLQKLWEFLCCQQGVKSCCDCHWFQEKKISKSDIQHSVHNPRLDSTSSHSESISSRDRVDSIDSRARTDSTSSTGTLMNDYRRAGKTPIIDMKPIEFWAANRESIQPRPKRRHPSEAEISVENFQRELYEVNKSEGLTDEQKLVRYQLGQIHFGLQYDVSEKVLMVKIIEAKDLPAPYCLDKERQDMARSNPYCKISLLPDQKNSQQSTVQRKTQDPTWNEYFMFEIPYKEAQMRILEILVKDFDKYSRHCVIGQFHLALNSVKLIKGGHMWKPLSPSSKERHDLGEILLSLNYLPSAGRLNVDIIKAKQLLQTDLVGGSDPFVKVTLTINDKIIKCKKTTCKKNTIDPVFNESINFNVSPRQLANASLVVSVWDYNSKSKDDFVGRIVLGKMATGPHEITHWSRMVQSQRSAIAQWHSLRTRQECDAVSAASIAVP